MKVIYYLGIVILLHFIAFYKVQRLPAPVSYADNHLHDIRDKTDATLGIPSCDVVCFNQLPVLITGLLPFDLLIKKNDKPEHLLLWK